MLSFLVASALLSKFDLNGLVAARYQCDAAVNVPPPGVEEMTALEHLDVSYNLLMSHAALSPLLELSRLSCLLLSGNPLCCLSDHRRRTAQRLHHNCRTGQVHCGCFSIQAGTGLFT